MQDPPVDTHALIEEKTALPSGLNKRAQTEKWLFQLRVIHSLPHVHVLPWTCPHCDWHNGFVYQRCQNCER